MKKLIVIIIFCLSMLFVNAQETNPFQTASKLSFISASLVMNNTGLNWDIPKLTFIKEESGINLSVQKDNTILISIDNERVSFPIDLHTKMKGFKDIVLMINKPLEELIKLTLPLEKELLELPNQINSLLIDQTNEPFSKFVMKFN